MSAPTTDKTVEQELVTPAAGVHRSAESRVWLVAAVPAAAVVTGEWIRTLLVTEAERTALALLGIGAVLVVLLLGVAVPLVIYGVVRGR